MEYNNTVIGFYLIFNLQFFYQLRMRGEDYVIFFYPNEPTDHFPLGRGGDSLKAASPHLIPLLKQ